MNIALGLAEVYATLTGMPGQRRVVGAIYDAILGHRALKVNAKTIYTWNTQDFLRLPPAIARRVKIPESHGS